MTPKELIEDILVDHGEIADRLRGLHAAMGTGDYSRMKSLLIELEVIERRHYAREDELMRAVAYDQADAHRAEHAAMLDTLSRINQHLALENASSISPQVVSHLEHALGHMVDADQKLDRFISAAGR